MWEKRLPHDGGYPGVIDLKLQIMGGDQMATIQISANANMLDVDTWYGTLAEYNSSEIVIESGAFASIYTGSFTYDTSGNVYGTLTGFSNTESGVIVDSVFGESVSANYAEQLIDSD